MRPRTILEKEVNTIVFEYTVANMPVSRIAKAHYVTPMTIYRYLKRRNIDCSKKIPVVNSQEFINDWNSGMSCANMKKKYGLRCTQQLHFFVNRFRHKGYYLEGRDTYGRSISNRNSRMC